MDISMLSFTCIAGTSLSKGPGGSSFRYNVEERAAYIYDTADL